MYYVENKIIKANNSINNAGLNIRFYLLFGFANTICIYINVMHIGVRFPCVSHN